MSIHDVVVSALEQSRTYCLDDAHAQLTNTPEGLLLGPVNRTSLLRVPADLRAFVASARRQLWGLSGPETLAISWARRPEGQLWCKGPSTGGLVPACWFADDLWWRLLADLEALAAGRAFADLALALDPRYCAPRPAPRAPQQQRDLSHVLHAPRQPLS